MSLIGFIAEVKEKDDEFPSISTELHVECTNDSFYISPTGYGDSCSINGTGCPIMIERWGGELRVIIWGDINQEDPTHIISLEGARESLRKEQ